MLDVAISEQVQGEQRMAGRQFSETERVAALHRYSILDSLPQREFDDIAEVAAMVCGTPIAQVSFIDADRQWIKASTGLPAMESPRAWSFCAHTIHTACSLVVADTWIDERFKTNPLVLGAPCIRSYAGAPIVDREGHVLGTVCAIDRAPNPGVNSRVAGLEALARQVVALLEQRKVILAQEQAAVDARARSESALKTTVERLHLSQEIGKIVTWEWDLNRDLFVWSGDSAWAFGRPPAELRTLGNMVGCMHPEDAPRVVEAIQRALAGENDYRSEFRVLWPDGSVHWTQAFGRRVGTAGTPRRLVGSNMDVTARKAAEEALLQNEKLAAVGRLASAIAHEINNPLEAVTNLIYLAQMSPEMPAAREYLGVAEVELRRVSEIVNQTLRFHRHAPKPQQVQCREIFQGVLAVQQSQITNAHVQVRLEDRTERPVECFEGEIRQVVNNLIGNAVQAMKSKGGRLLLRGQPGREWASGRRGIVLTVADTGPGIPPENMARIFEAFFTTKGIGGTGLGLWVSKEIVHRHGGSLRVKSSQRGGCRGTAFRVFLPFEMERRGSEAVAGDEGLGLARAMA